MDDSIKKLFEDFNPELSSDADFMKRLNDRLDAVEYIKKKAAADSRRNRLSLWVASLAGFLAGSLTTLAVPYLTELLASLKIFGICLVDPMDRGRGNGHRQRAERL